MTTILNGLIITLNGSTLWSILAKVTVVLAVALAGTRLARRSSAAVRHVFLAAAFAVLLGLPIASFVVPTIRIEVPVAAQNTATSSVEKIPYAVSPASHESTSVDTGTSAAPRGFSSSELLRMGWMFVSIAFLLPIGAGLWQMRSLRKTEKQWAEGQSIVEELAIEAGIHRRIEVLLHEAVSGPMTCGVVHPTILLPVDATAWPE